MRVVVFEIFSDEMNKTDQELWEEACQASLKGSLGSPSYIADADEFCNSMNDLVGQGVAKGALEVLGDDDD